MVKSLQGAKSRVMNIPRPMEKDRLKQFTLQMTPF